MIMKDYKIMSVSDRVIDLHIARLQCEKSILVYFKGDFLKSYWIAVTAYFLLRDITKTSGKPCFNKKYFDFLRPDYKDVFIEAVDSEEKYFKCNVSMGRCRLLHAC